MLESCCSYVKVANLYERYLTAKWSRNLIAFWLVSTV